MSSDSRADIDHAPPAASPRPNRTAGALKSVLGLALIAASVYLYNEHARHTSNEPKAAEGVITGLAAGLGLWLLMAGTGNLSGRRPGWVPGVLILAACVTAGALAEPRVLQARRVRLEQEAWERLQASPRNYTDYEQYELWAPYDMRRTGIAPAKAMARTHEELARLETAKTDRIATLRRLIHEHSSGVPDHERADMQPAIDLAREALSKEYVRALDDIDRRVAAEAAATLAAGAKREFPDDPDMREAFRTMLMRLARSDDDHVYVAFASEGTLTVPPGSPATGPDWVIPPGDAFSPDRENRRRRAFMTAMEDAIKSAMGEPVVRLNYLSAGEPRQGKVVLDVRCKTRQTPGGFTLTRDDKPAGTLLNFDVDWTLAVVDTDGRTLARKASSSNPAGSVGFRHARGDPSWAPYSVLMDSAYYNYCREITGRLGLRPPPVREYFAFEQ